ncbi:hypothetical protein SAMN05444366_0320 [Flavobacterium saccharophilum]|uniref:Uncharacterized protein n=1 Tax=Flavobacterium saccharophilum TaxID=29534 RepID=A0A1M6ZLR3_9FLAO|nr:hypothetical protein SAMN05444366_0320 [Flavobacterium saccharophilum]
MFINLIARQIVTLSSIYNFIIKKKDKQWKTEPPYNTTF